MKKNVIIVFIFTCILFGLIIYQKNKIESVQIQDEMVAENDSILKMFDEKREQEQTSKEKSTHDIDSLVTTLKGDKLTIELMIGTKEELVKTKKESNKKDVIIDSLTNSYTTKFKNLDQTIKNLENENKELSSPTIVKVIIYDTVHVVVPDTTKITDDGLLRKIKKHLKTKE
jgi:hypothetical protein